MSARNRAQALREDFIVCHAAGYPDPVRFTSLAAARTFAQAHTFDHARQQPVAPVIKRRLITDYQVVK